MLRRAVNAFVACTLPSRTMLRSRKGEFAVKMISRRNFLGANAAGLTAVCLARGIELDADPLGLPIGCQTWPVRESIGNDLDGTLRTLAAAGFRAIEMCSPPGYAKAGFGPLESLKASALRARIHAAGLACQSCHYGFRESHEHASPKYAGIFLTSTIY
jgi:hypothetical protein